MEDDIPFDYGQMHHWNLGRPFIVRSNGEEVTYPANAGWREEEDGRLRVGGTHDQEHERLQVSWKPEGVMMEGGVVSVAIAREYAPGTWAIEHVLPE